MGISGCMVVCRLVALVWRDSCKREVVLGRKYCFNLCLYSNGRLLMMFEIGPGLGCMSPLSRMILELFHV